MARKPFEPVNFYSMIPIVTGTLVDNAQVGTARACIGRTFSTSLTDTAFAHGLGRIPNGYLPFRSRLGGVMRDGVNHGSDWTSTSITLQTSTPNDVVSFFVL